MKRILLSVTLGLLSGLGSTTLAHNNSVDTLYMSLAQAVELSVGQSHAVMAAAEGQKSAMHLRKAAFGYRVPNISAMASYTYMSQDVGRFDFNGPKNDFADVLSGTGLPLLVDVAGKIKGVDLSYTFQNQQFGVVGVGVAMPLFLGGKINALAGAARVGERQAEQRTEQVKADLYAQVSAAYWGVALSNNLSMLANQAFVAMQRHCYNAGELEKNGMIAHTEVLYAQMKLEQAQQAYLSAVGDAQTAAQTLASLTMVEQTIVTTSTLEINDSLPELEHVQQMVQSSNPQLEQVRLAVEMAHQGVRAVRSEFMPQLAVTGAYDIYDYQLSKQLPRWVVGASLRLNIFDGLTREHNYAGARSKKKEAQQMVLSAQMELRIVIEKLYNQMVNARRNALSQGASMEFASQYLYSCNQAFDQGVGTLAEVIDAQLLLDTAKSRTMIDVYQYKMLRSQLSALAGYDAIAMELDVN